MTHKQCVYCCDITYWNEELESWEHVWTDADDFCSWSPDNAHTYN